MKSLCRSFGLNPSRKRFYGAQVSKEIDQQSVWEVAVARSHLMKAEAVVGSLARGCRKLLEVEMKLSEGGSADMFFSGTGAKSPRAERRRTYAF